MESSKIYHSQITSQKTTIVSSFQKHGFPKQKNIFLITSHNNFISSSLLQTKEQRDKVTLLLHRQVFTTFDIILQKDFPITIKSSYLLILGVYLQPTSADCDFKEIYQSQLVTFTGIIKQFSKIATTILIGDFQLFPFLIKTATDMGVYIVEKSQFRYFAP